MTEHEKNIRAVIFDMDGVLIDSEMLYLEISHRYFSKKNPNLKIEDFYGTVGLIAKDSWTIIEKVVNNGQSWEELRKEYRNTALGEYDLIDYRKAFRPEVPPLLATLKEKNYRLAVASSNDLRTIQRVLRENQIADYFDTIITGAQFKQSKPSPEIYHCTAKALNLPESQCFVLEDSTPGITAAHRAGMTVAALIDDRFGFDRSLADYEVKNVRDILKYL